ncbi:hypothetical protein Tco_0627681 [Tanacetum coccineum]|uniref:Uncharacterized protein n=1 Tax=Tanacetum coccineum TaxID=301880 RepID=A0ABQ4WN55_9ASTR
MKARLFLNKLSALCEEQGLNRFEIKLLGGLELMVVMENTETTYNVLKDKEHGLRRWLHKLRRGDDFHRMAGRMTWINIIGISILLEGNQNNIAGRVHIHTIYKGLIREELNIKVNGRVHKINVVEEVARSSLAVMAASTILVSAEENLGDPIDIRVDVIHPEPVAAVAFPAAAIMGTQAQHGEAIRGIQEHLLGVPIQEELTALRFRADIAEAENASLRARNQDLGGNREITRTVRGQLRVKIEQQLAAVSRVLESGREDL